MEKSIHIVLIDTEDHFDGEFITTISEDNIKNLTEIVIEYEKLNKKVEKLREKRQQALRKANKLMKRIIASHGIQYDQEKQAVGISKQDIIYVGEKKRVTAEPDADPQENDIIKGKVTKYERRKYNELLETFKYINEQIKLHNEMVQANENKLIAFEKSVLKDKKYSRENDVLVVSSINGNVFLCSKK